MKTKKYKVVRSRVYYGEVCVPSRMDIRNNERRLVEYRPVRNILFELTDEGNANDLLNKVRDYPVLGYGNVLLGQYAVVNPICLEDVLDYLGYFPLLGHYEINVIRDELFSGHFASDNPEIFGLTKIEEKGRRKFIKMEESLIDSYFLRRFDNLRKRTILEVLFEGAECRDPFKVKFK